MKYSIIFLFTAITTLNTFSQVNSIQNIIDQYNETERREINIDKIVGSQYRYEKFDSGEVYFIGTDKSVKCLLNYNAYKDELEFIKDQKKYSVTNPENIKKVFLNKEEIIYINYLEKDSLSNGYFIEKMENKISLLKKDEIIILPPKKAKNSYDNDLPARFEKAEPKYYISITGEPAFLIKSKNIIFKKFKSRTDLKKYLKTEKIDIKSEEDLIKLVTFLNK